MWLGAENAGFTLMGVGVTEGIPTVGTTTKVTGSTVFSGRELFERRSVALGEELLVLRAFIAVGDAAKDCSDSSFSFGELSSLSGKFSN